MRTRDRAWQLTQVSYDALIAGGVCWVVLAGLTGWFRGDAPPWAALLYVPVPLFVTAGLTWAIFRTSIEEVEGHVEVQGLWRIRTVPVEAIVGVSARKMSSRRASAVLLVREEDRSSRVVVRALPYDKLAEPLVLARLPFLEPLL